jgi:hypothetical protein
MKKYHKIQTVYLRDPETHFKTLLEGQFALPEFEYLASNEWLFSEKVDGTNTRIMFDGNEISFGGKTDESILPSVLTAHLHDIFDGQLDKFVKIFHDGVCLYGEGYGAKIQKGGGKYNPNGVDFILFDIRIGDWWLTRDTVEDIASNLGLFAVPEIGKGTLYDMVEMTRKGFNSKWGEFMAEGIVARPAVEFYGRNGERVITKIKHRDFREG